MEFLDIILPLETIGRIQSAAMCFFEGVASSDEKLVLKNVATNPPVEIGLSLFRSEPSLASRKIGFNVSPSDADLAGRKKASKVLYWLEIVDGLDSKSGLRFQLYASDLLSMIEACRCTTLLAMVRGAHKSQ